MTDKDFASLWGKALQSNDRDMYVAEWATSSIWGDPEEIPDAGLCQIADQLGTIWDVAHMGVKELWRGSGLSQAAFATRFCIPKRTIEDWCTAKRTPPDYIRLMIAEALGIIKR